MQQLLNWSKKKYEGSIREALAMKQKDIKCLMDKKGTEDVYSYKR